MSTWLYFTLKLAHILSITLWLGGPLIAALGLRSSITHHPADAQAHLRRLQALTPVLVAAALAAVLSGLGLIYAAGGFSAVRRSVLAGALLGLGTFPIGGAIIRPALAKLQQAVEARSPEAPRLAGRFLTAHHVEQAVKVLALALMVLPLPDAAN